MYAILIPSISRETLTPPAGGLASRDYQLSLLAVAILLFDPLIGMPKALVERRVGLPFQDLLDERVVAVAAADAARGAEIVLPLEPDAGYSFHLADQLINRDQLA